MSEDIAGRVRAALDAAVAAGDAEAVEGGQAWRRPAPTRQAYDPTRIRERLVVLLSKGSRKATDIFLDVLACGAPKGFALPDLRTNLTAIGATMVDPMGEKWGLASGGVEGATGQPTRAEQVRLALLAVLSRGAVVGLSYVLEALSAEGVRPAPDGVEACRASVEIGAMRDGARWSLSEGPPPGWVWCPFDVIGESRLIPVGCSDPILGAVARIVLCHGVEGMRWTALGEPGSPCKSVEEGQAAALAAARRAGLFARPVAVEVTSDGGPPVVPAVTALGGEAVVKVAISPLPSGQLLARHIERMHGIGEGESSCVLAQLIEANNVAVEERAFQRMHDIAKRTAEELREERIGAPIPHDAVEASLAQRAYAADAPLLYAVWKAATTMHEAHQRRVRNPVGTFAHNDARGAEEDTKARLYAILDAAERDPRDPAPHPHRDGNEEPWETIERLAREAAEARTSIGVAIRQRDAAERERAEYLSKALAAETREGEEHNRRCEAERELAALQAGLDGLRTWATDARAAGK